MRRGVHSNSLRYAVALWLATVLALGLAFQLQLEPAQWSAITVWIVFMQDPRLNYSKVIWWTFGTVAGAFMAVVLTAFFNQAPELYLLFLALWLAACAAWAPLVSSYRAYGAVLAGYTCAIVSMSAVDHPDLVFQLAVTRVSCIFVGMASAIFFIFLFLPKHGHWLETRHHLGEHLKASLAHASAALAAGTSPPTHFAWRHMVARLSTLEHTLDITTTETADSRIHAAQARSLVAALFCLLAKAQAMGMHLSRPGTAQLPDVVQSLMGRANVLLASAETLVSAEVLPERVLAMCAEIERLRTEVRAAQRSMTTSFSAENISSRFVLDRLDDILVELAQALQDWAGLFGKWTARRGIDLAVHRDYRTAAIYGIRMFLAMGLASALWFITEWPSGAQLILFIAVVCSLLSLLDHAPVLGLAFVKSAVVCAIMAGVTAFWLLQLGSGFLVLALALGVFLLPAAYAYRHPRLIGSAVVSMLIFYGLTMPANQMNYDISAFLNNGLGLLAATICGFFAFHAVPSLTPEVRRSGLLRATQNDLARTAGGHGPLAEQDWASRMFDRLRLWQRAAGSGQRPSPADWLAGENEMLVSLQLGLRQRRLRDLIRSGQVSPAMTGLVTPALAKFKMISEGAGRVASFLKTTCAAMREVGRQEGADQAEHNLSALAELQEMTLLLEMTAPVYTD